MGLRIGNHQVLGRQILARAIDRESGMRQHLGRNASRGSPRLPSRSDSTRPLSPSLPLAIVVAVRSKKGFVEVRSCCRLRNRSAARLESVESWAEEQ